MPAVDAAILRVESVSKRFLLPGNRALRAVNEVSLELYPRECLSIVGESGCGKSTLAKMITMVTPVSDGKIFFQGIPIEHSKGEALRQIRRKMQIIFQDPMSAFSPRMRIGDFLCEPFINYRIMGKRDAIQHARALLSSVELPVSFIGRYPHQLSGGELQRVAIARAMALNPLVLVCDEPTSALDVSIQEQIIGLLDGLRREHGVSILFISHDLALVHNFSDRVMVMYLGHVLEIMKSSELADKAAHPYTRALLRATLGLDKNRDVKIETLKGDPPSPVDLPPGCPFSSRCSIAGDICHYELPPLLRQEEGHCVACHMNISATII
jgi:oligopeptide/dipeptide ABC transporter ATP-binding protein